MKKVMAALWGGPGSDAHSVGYSESQIAPWSQIHSSDHAQAQRLSRRIAADWALAISNGSDHAVGKSIAKDDAGFNEVCPGMAR